jgi:hypothetical protein
LSFIRSFAQGELVSNEQPVKVAWQASWDPLATVPGCLTQQAFPESPFKPLQG